MRLIIFMLMLIGFSANAQYQNGLKINPDQDKNKQYIGMSSNGKQILGKKNRPYGTYETKGSFKSVLLTDFADALANYMDSLSLVGGSGSDSANIFNQPVTKDRLMDAGGFDFDIENIRSFEFNPFAEGSNERLSFDFNYDGAVRIETGSLNALYVESLSRMDIYANGDFDIGSTDNTTIQGDNAVNIYSGGAITLTNDLGDIIITPLDFADGSEDYGLVYDDATGKVMKKEAATGGEVNYYEWVGVLVFESGSLDVDTVYSTHLQEIL